MQGIGRILINRFNTSTKTVHTKYTKRKEKKQKKNKKKKQQQINEIINKDDDAAITTIIFSTKTNKNKKLIQLIEGSISMTSSFD